MNERRLTETTARHVACTLLAACTLMIGTATAGGDHEGGHDHGHGHSDAPATEAFFPEDGESDSGETNKHAAADCPPATSGPKSKQQPSDRMDVGKQSASASCRPRQAGGHHAHGGDGDHDADRGRSHAAHDHPH